MRDMSGVWCWCLHASVPCGELTDRHCHMPQQAVLSGDIKRFDATKRMDPFDCVKRENQGFTIELTRHWGADVQT